MGLRIQRIYEPAAKSDGVRVLVDRIWPRGVSKERAAIDHWIRELAPSTELRKWFGHDPARWREFKSRYAEELDGQRDRIAELLRWAEDGVVTLLYSARDTEHNQAQAILEILDAATASDD